MITSYIESAFESTNHDLDRTMKKVNAYVEAAKRQLEINYAESDLKVMQENGTADDLAFLYEEANEGFIKSIIAAIKKIVEAVAKFFSDVRDKIVNTIDTTEKRAAFDSVEKKVKLYPLVANKKIIVENYDAEASLATQFMAKLHGLKSKFIAGQDVTSKDVHDLEESFIEKHGKIIGVAAATTITIGAAIAIGKKMLGDTSKEVQRYQKMFDDFADETTKAIASGKVENPVIGEALVNTAQVITKTGTNDFMRTLKDIVSKIKEGAKGVKNVPIVGKSVTDALGESFEDDDYSDPIDADPSDVSDPWDEVMSDIAIPEVDDDSVDDDECDGDDCGDEEDECGTECGTECGSYGECNEYTSFDEAFASYFEDTDADSDADSMPENSDSPEEESEDAGPVDVKESLDDLFESIRSEVTTESTLSPVAEKLLNQINDLF